MEWTKVKNILIVIFIILNVSLIILSSKYYFKSDISKDNINNAIVALKERGVKLSCDLITENLSLGTLHIDNSFQISTISEKLIETKIEDTIVNKKKYENENKSIEYLSKDMIVYSQKLENPTNTMEEKEKSFLHIIEKNSDINNIEFKNDSNQPTLNSNKIIYRQIFKEHYIFDNYIEFDLIDNMKINARINYKKVKEEKMKKTIMPIHQVLLKNYTNEDVEIVNIEIGYKEISFQDSIDEIVYIPVWRLITKKNLVKYYRAYSGEELLDSSLNKK